MMSSLKAKSYIKMEIGMRVRLLIIIRGMDSVSIIIVMERSMRENGPLERKLLIE